MKPRVLLVCGALLVGAGAVRCVGDSSTPIGDGGTDATTDQFVGGDGSPDADGAACTKTCQSGDVCVDGVHCGLDVREVASGSANYALLYNGDVYAWGNNSWAETGTLPDSSNAACDGGVYRCLFAPTKVAGLPAATQLSAGAHFACGVAAKDGVVWCWGQNSAGELGHTPSASPTCSYVAGDGGTVDHGPCDTPHAVAGIPDPVVEVAAGQVSACALTDKGDVFCWGDNSQGELGNGAAGGLSTTPVGVVGFNHDVTSVRVSVGGPFASACATRTDGSAWCWGNDQSSRLAHDTSLDPASDVAACGNPCSATPVHIAQDSGGNPFGGVVEVDLNQSGVVARRNDGTVWGWGAAGYDGLATSAAAPSQLGGIGNAVALSGFWLTGMILDGGGRLWAFDGVGGVTCDLGIGQQSGSTAVMSPQELGNFADVKAVSEGFAGLALDTSGAIWGWGDNGTGLLAHTPGTNGDTACDATGGACALSPVLITGVP
jgi:alpha-tubulin suppressor-like RCC1 family protein